MKILKLAFFLIFSFQIICSNAQALKQMEKVELLPTNLHAAQNLRLDKNGEGCAVLFVHSTIPNLKFEGNIVGEIANESGTYYVYLMQGTSKLEINKANNKILLKFPKVGVKTVYQTTIEYANEYGSLEIFSDPSGASVELISNQDKISLGSTPIKGNVDIKTGNYTVILSKKGFESKTINNVKITADKITKLGTKKLKRQ